MPSDQSTSGSERYCCHCDADTAEVEHDQDGDEICPRCKSSLYEDYDAYRDEMVRWLGEQYDLTEAETIEILTTHGNPGKGQASAILTERDDGLRADGGQPSTDTERLEIGRSSGEEPGAVYMKSPISGRVYRVTEWEHIGDKKFRAEQKEELEDAECSDPSCDAEAFGIFDNGVFREPRCKDHAQGDDVSLVFTLPGGEQLAQ